MCTLLHKHSEAPGKLELEELILNVLATSTIKQQILQGFFPLTAVFRNFKITAMILLLTWVCSVYGNRWLS